MKGNQAQRKSELVKHGETESHEKAKTRLVNILMDNGWEVMPDTSLHITSVLRSDEHSRLWDNDYYHEFDIYCRKRHDNGLVSELILEIDGSSHDSKVQQGKDKTAYDYASFFLPDARFHRVPIEFLIGKFPEKDEQFVKRYNLK